MSGGGWPHVLAMRRSVIRGSDTLLVSFKCFQCPVTGVTSWLHKF
jgi:hypothetical protein